MKTIDLIWYVIIGFWVYAAFTSNQWLGFIAVPLFVGLFIIITNKKQVDDRNAFYVKMSKKIPLLFPPSWIGKTSYKAQGWITVLIGILFIVFAVSNFIRIYM